jgi:hypothetical protein
LDGDRSVLLGGGGEKHHTYKGLGRISIEEKQKEVAS